MESVGIVLASAAAVAWGTADFLAGRASTRWSAAGVVLGVQGIGLTGLALIWFADGAQSLPWRWTLALAGLAMVLGLAALYGGLARGPIGVVAPLSALSGAVPVAVGWASGESLGGWQLIGIGIALAGVALVAWPIEPVRSERRRVRSAVFWGLAAALALGGALTLLGWGGRERPLASVLVTRASAVAVAAGWFVWRRIRSGESWGSRRPLGLIASAGLLDAAATLGFTVAARLAPLGGTGLLASLYPVATVALAAVFLRERLGAVRLGGMVAVFVGVALLVG